MLHHNIRSRTTPPAVTAQIVAIDVLAPDVRCLTLQLHEPFSYRAGQYVSLVLPDGSRRSLSPACAMRTGGTVMFHVQRQENGVLTRLAFQDFRAGDQIAIEGPFGTSVLGQPAAATIMLATGTGIAPLIAMLEENFAARTPREITLFWGARDERDLYAAPLLAEWSRQHAGFRFVPVISGRDGYAQDAAAAAFPDLSGIDIYACGSPRMVDGAKSKLLALPGACPDRFYADPFEPAGRSVASTITAIIDLHLIGTGSIPIPLPAGASLLAGLANAGLPIGSVCGGQASCGTCRVKIAPEWQDQLPPPNKAERRLLACLQDPDPAHRLACQITLDANLAGLAFSLDP